MSKIKVAIIGCGHWGPNHVRVFSQLPGSQVVACADLDPNRLAAIREQFPQIQTFADSQEMLRAAPLDAVVVSVPTRAHYEVVRTALAAGMHVLCEKPLCANSREAQALVDLAAQSQRTLMPGHVFLFNAGILKLKELVDAGEAGRICCLRALRTNLGPVRRDVNSVFDLATHDIAIFNFVLKAQPTCVSASGGQFLQPDIEDVAFITLRYPGNILANIAGSWLDPKKQREIVVVGDKKMLAWDDLGAPGPIHIYDKAVVRHENYTDYGQFQLLAREGDITIPKVRLEEPLKAQNRYFLQCIREGRMPMNDGAFAIAVVKVLEAIEKSLRADGAPMAVEP